MFRHLKEIEMSYLTHLLHAWRMSFILFIHGLIPSIWETKVSDEIIDESNKCDGRNASHKGDHSFHPEHWRKGTLWERTTKK